MRKLPRAALVLSLAAIPLAACDTLGLGSDDHNVSVSFSVPGSSAGGGGAAALVAADTISDGTHRIDLQEVDLVLNKVVLERARGDDINDDDDDSDHDGRRDHRLRAGAVTIELPIAGGVITPINAPLPDGTYEEIRLDIAFVRARGTFDGQPFDITVAIDSRLEMDLDPEVVIDDDADRINVTVTVDLRSWFLANGVLIDPRAAQLNETLRRSLSNRIRASFRAFEDEDRDADDRDTDTDTDRRDGDGHRGHG